MKKTLALTQILITLMTLGIAFIQPINAQYQGNITINADYSINPSTAPIQKKSTIFYLTSDIVGSITVNANSIVFDGSGHAVSSLLLQSTLNVTVKNFVVTMKNEFTETIGLSLDNATNNLVNNTVTGFWSVQALNGIIFAGIHVRGGNSNIINQNNLMSNLVGIECINTSSNLIVQNNITSDSRRSPYTTGICFGEASNNKVYYNNIVNNYYQTYNTNSINVWDNGFPSGGNYWSDYHTKYPSASVMENSGIGNTPYYIDAQNKDDYPLMEPFHGVPQIESSPTPTPTNSRALADRELLDREGTYANGKRVF